MTVKEIMQKDVATCTPNDDVATAVKIMHDHKCGFVPIVDSHGVVIGVADLTPSNKARFDALSGRMNADPTPAAISGQADVG